MKRFRRDRHERGQAIAELLISLLAIAAVLLGVIMVSVMGISGIKNIIETRTEAERKMTANAFGAVQPQNITEWIHIRRSGSGKDAQFLQKSQKDGDGIQFTQDDEAVTAQTTDGKVFTDELKPTDETFSITEEGTHTVTRAIGNIESLPVYRIKGVLTAGASNYISITTNGTEMKVMNATLSEGETLVVDTDRMTAYVVDENGETLRNGLPYLQELNFPTLAVVRRSVFVTPPS